MAFNVDPESPGWWRYSSRDDDDFKVGEVGAHWPIIGGALTLRREFLDQQLILREVP